MYPNTAVWMLLFLYAASPNEIGVNLFFRGPGKLSSLRGVYGSSQRLCSESTPVCVSWVWHTRQHCCWLPVISGTGSWVPDLQELSQMLVMKFGSVRRFSLAQSCLTYITGQWQHPFMKCQVSVFNPKFPISEKFQTTPLEGICT